MRTGDRIEINDKNILKEIMEKLKNHFPKERLNNLWLTYYSFRST